MKEKNKQDTVVNTICICKQNSFITLITLNFIAERSLTGASYVTEESIFNTPDVAAVECLF